MSAAAAGVQAVDEGFLAELGVVRLSVPVPFPEAAGPVNAYAIDNGDGSWSLFDAAVGTADGQHELDTAVAQAGLRVSHLSRIFVSHGHVDHFGNAQRLAAHSGATVYVHRDDRSKVQSEVRGSAVFVENRGYFLRHGVPEAQLEALSRGAGSTRPFGLPVEETRLAALEGGQRLRFRCFEAEVMHLPGHTPGLVGLHAPAQRLLFSTDHLLERVSPNPVLDFVFGADEPGKFRALPRYLEGIRRVRELELDAVLPGHGPLFRGHRALIDGLLDFYRLRQEKILPRLRRGPATLFEVTVAVLPRWSTPKLYLMLSEVLGNLEVLEDAGRVGRERGGSGADTGAGPVMPERFVLTAS